MHQLTDLDPKQFGYKQKNDFVFDCVQGKRKNLWYQDSGCFRKMSEDSTMLIEFVERADPSITFGDESKGYTIGQGLISKQNVIIDSVALVDGLKHNLLSISQLCDNGNEAWFTKEACVIFDKTTRNILLTRNKNESVYVADFNSTSSEGITCLFSKANTEEIQLWHKKLPHLNFKAMNLLVKKNLVRGLPKVELTKDGLCDASQTRKQRKSSFKSRIESSIDEPLQLLHMDLFGPVNIMSMSKKMYCLVIIYDFTRFSQTFFLHSKPEKSQFIINHIKVVDNGTKWTVKKIMSDNGTECKNFTMKYFCNEK